MTVTLNGYRAPYLDPSFSLSYNMSLNSVKVLSIPVKDAEGQNVTTKLSPSAGFISLSNNVMTISPTKTAEIGSHLLNLTLSDGILNTSYQLNITVINTAPIFFA